MRLKITLLAAAALALAVPGQAMAAPKAKLRFETTTVVAGESSGSALVTVTRAPRNGKAKSTLNTAVSVAYAASNGTAGSSDYTAVSGRLNFAAGDASESFLVPITSDTNIEGPETVNLALSAPSRGAVVVNPSTSVLTIADDDGPVQLHFSAPTYSVSEFGPSATVTVVRTGQIGATTSTVQYATANDTAGASDYTAQSGTLTFGTGDVEETISVPVSQDTDVEGTEAFDVNLTSPTNAVFANSAASLSAPVTIIDDDTASGNAELSFSAATYSGAENGSGIAVTIVRSGRVDKAVTADINSADGTAVAGVDYEALTDLVEFDEGDITQTLVLPVTDDNAVEGDETFSLALSGPTGGVLASPSSATLTIADNDTTPVVVETPVEVPVEVPGETPAPQVTEVTNVTNVTNTTFVNPLADQDGLLVLGERVGSCKLSIAAVKGQRILRAKSVRVKLHAVESCTGNVKSHVKGRKSLRGVKKGAVQTKVVKFALKAGQTKTIKMTFSKRGYALLKRALGKQKTLSASLLVRSINSAKRVTLTTRSWKAKR